MSNFDDYNHVTQASCIGNEAKLIDCDLTNYKIGLQCYYLAVVAVDCYSLVPDPSAEDGDVKLVGGENDWEGTLQAFHDQRWGTVCSDNWSANNAFVVCRQLGYTGIITPNRSFGPGYGPIHLGEVVCTGDEYTLTACSHSEWGASGCTSHEQDVGVECTEERLGEEGNIRLAGGPSSDRGRIEIFHENRWGTICNNNWSRKEALVACRQLGFPGVAISSYYYRPAEGDLRLVGGTSSDNGRLEIYHDYEWGTICDSTWSAREAVVACRQLDFPSVSIPFRDYGSGEGPIHLERISCTGTEWQLRSCDIAVWGTSNCEHSQDVGIKCSRSEQKEGNLRLVDGLSPDHGRLEIFHDYEWGTICDYSWSMEDAVVACRQLGFLRVVTANVFYGGGEGPIHLKRVSCNGSESKLINCNIPEWGTRYCQHSNDVGIYCSSSLTHQTNPPAPSPQNQTVIYDPTSMTVDTKVVAPPSYSEIAEEMPTSN
ncbi:scavenger receptor cysteine-rich domain superfamily protein-like [Diadema antillarum]|uniref:scavenger receptor cysteine-rich domain superfamily protein-like n=1 Tax=Diadema antillarum TaxID=105358 RepID=UPI003A8963AC